MAGRDELDPINEFIATLGVGGFEHAVDTDGTLWASYGIANQPAFAFVNDDGSVETHLGPLGTDGLTEAIEDLAAS